MNEKLISRAAFFARVAHGEQKRKYTGEPYWYHLSEVADIVREHGLGAEAIAAAWLHDTLEDTATTREQLLDKFGARVTQLVDELTDVSKPQDGNRAFRKALDRAHLAGASATAQSIKLADLISNTISIVANDPHFARVYLKEKEALLDVMTKGNASLMWAARRLLADSKETLKKS